MELELTPQELAIKRAETANKKTMIQREIQVLNNKIHGSGRLPNHEFQQLMRRKSEFAREMTRLDTELQELKMMALRMHRSVAPNDMQSQGLPPKEKASTIQEEPKKLIVTRLNELRQYYQEFAADGTRSPTMRRMASEFALKLSGIIREAISKKDA